MAQKKTPTSRYPEMIETFTNTLMGHRRRRRIEYVSHISLVARLDMHQLYCGKLIYIYEMPEIQQFLQMQGDLSECPKKKKAWIIYNKKKQISVFEF